MFLNLVGDKPFLEWLNVKWQISTLFKGSETVEKWSATTVGSSVCGHCGLYISIMDEPVAAGSRTADVIHVFDAVERVLDANITSECPHGFPVFPDSDLFLHGTSSANLIQSAATGPQIWNEMFHQSKAPTQEPLFAESGDPLNYQSSPEPSIKWLSIPRPSTHATKSYHRSTEHNSFLNNNNHLPDSDSKQPMFQSTPGDTKNRTFHYQEHQHMISDAKLLAPSLSAGLSENGSNREEAFRRKSHRASDKRYRSSLNRQFLKLQEVLTKSHLQNKAESSWARKTQRMTRVNLLIHAREEILSLREHAKALKEKLGNMRQFALPTTFDTLHHS